MTTAIKISGSGGQGVKLLAHVLGAIIAEMGKKVSINYDYDTAVWGGGITADLIYSDQEIGSPLIEKPQIKLQLDYQKEDKILVKRTLVKSGKKTIATLPLQKIAEEKLGTPRVLNMVVLGNLLKLLGINLEGIDLKKYLPPKFIEKNIEAIQYGYRIED